MRIPHIIITLLISFCLTAFNIVAIGRPIDDSTETPNTDLNQTGNSNVDSDSWLITWGGGLRCIINEVVIDEAGNIYVVGTYEGEVDLDPGPGIDSHVSTGEYDQYVTRFDQSGRFLWTRIWDEPGIHGQFQIAVDQFGNTYLAGNYEGTVDLDPGEDTNEHTSNGHTDVFLLKLNPSGDFEWAATWGSPRVEYSPGLDVQDDGAIYVAGTFKETVDFDPGPGINEINAGDRERAVFLSRFNTDGELIWVRIFAESDFLGPFCDEVKVDNQGDVYLTGYYEQTIRFSSADTADEFSSNGQWDVFLCKFSASGEFEWARTWGGVEIDMYGDIAFDSVGNVYTTGYITNQGTYNISDENEEIQYGLAGVVSNETSDIYLISFSSSGIFQWVREWGGPGFDYAGNLVIDANNTIYLEGSSQITVDTPFERPYHGDTLPYMATFDTSGVYLGNTDIGNITENGNSYLTVDSLGFMYLVGSFRGVVEFELPWQNETRYAAGTDAFLVKIARTYPIEGK